MTHFIEEFVREFNERKMRPNKVYGVSYNTEGKLTTFKLMGDATSTEPLPPYEEPPHDIQVLDEVVDKILEHVRAGSMVVALNAEFLQPEDVLRVDLNPLGVGFIVYDKKATVACDSLDEAVNLAVTYTLSGLSNTKYMVIRYKRRQSKWFVHQGAWVPTLRLPFKPSDEPKRIYELSIRSHMWGAQDPTEQD